MTPEERLLALIQQEKQPVAPVTEQPNGGRPQVGATEEHVERVRPQVGATEGGEKKLKLATSASASQETSSDHRSVLQEGADHRPVLQPVISEARPPETAAAAGSVSGHRIPIFRSGRSNGLVLFNRVLAGVVLVLLVVVVYSVASIGVDVEDAGKRLEAGTGAQPVVMATVLKESLPSVDVFLDKTGGRNVFEPKDAVETQPKGVVLTGKLADLKLVGVSIDTSAGAGSTAIIRNKAESKTYFVNEGQTVGDTGYTLDKVLADRAILKMGKQEIELK